MKKALFIDRDGTIIREPEDEQVDSLEKFSFLPGAIRSLAAIRELTGYELVMVTNQDGLGTPAYPQECFDSLQRLLLDTLASAGVVFDDILIDTHFPEDNAPTRKPGTGMLTAYTGGEYDMEACYVIGDRATDVQLAQNLGCRALQIGDGMDWEKILEIVVAGERSAEVHRTTRETDIFVKLELDRPGVCEVSTGLPFFDHMLEQIAHHGGMGLTIRAKGDLQVDAHHTMEDTALALGDCLRRALGDKLGISRYGYCLPMDDCLCRVALDFGGRPWLQWDAAFRTESVGGLPTEMFMHFFKSLSDAARMNLSVSARGENAHHLAESMFKALARALRMAAQRDVRHLVLPSSKGTL